MGWLVTNVTDILERSKPGLLLVGNADASAARAVTMKALDTILTCQRMMFRVTEPQSSDSVVQMDDRED